MLIHLDASMRRCMRSWMISFTYLGFSQRRAMESFDPLVDFGSFFYYMLLRYPTMAPVILCVTQPKPVKDCISFLLYHCIFIVLSRSLSVLARLQDGKDDIMEPLQRCHCCELALGLYSVRRRPSAVPNCKCSFAERRAQSPGQG